MSFNYQKGKEHGSNDSFWTSYSDLFLGLSTVFLLLYVVASLRTGTEGLRNQIENEKLSRQVSELEHQLKTYESIKNEYLEKQASKEENQEYQELMDKLTLLQEEAKTEKEKLIEKALENDKKVQALNKYQQMVRNVLNANKVAKTKLNTREDFIKEQDETIQVKDSTIQDRENQIANLNSEITEKQQLIENNERQIQENQKVLAQRAEQLKKAFQQNQLTKANYEKQLSSIKSESEKIVQELNQNNAAYRNQLMQASNQLGNLQQELSAKEGQVQKLVGDLDRTKAESQAQLAKAQEGLAKVKAASDAKVANLSGKLSEANAEVAKVRAELNARREVANEIKKGFAAKGIKADVDLKTGDVVLDFGEAYFDSGSSKLKTQMKAVIEKAIPVYSKALLGNPKVSDKISSVEIIGFASPTYKGRYIDPTSKRSEDKAALKYNMDLSFQRANAIFNYMLDNPNLKFPQQEKLTALMKVSGRSFLEIMDVKKRNPSSAAEFCKQNDCKKAQRVIIRFNMDPKK